MPLQRASRCLEQVLRRGCDLQAPASKEVGVFGISGHARSFSEQSVRTVCLFQRDPERCEFLDAPGADPLSHGTLHGFPPIREVASSLCWLFP